MWIAAMAWGYIHRDAGFHNDPFSQEFEDYIYRDDNQCISKSLTFIRIKKNYPFNLRKNVDLTN